MPTTGDHFPDPFCDMASLAMPTNNVDALAWCEYIAYANTTYSSALRRIVSYFITDIEILSDEAGRDEKEKYYSFLVETLRIKEQLYNVGMDFLAYGNSFVSVLLPFRRYLQCPRCFAEYPFRELANNPQSGFGFDLRGVRFSATCRRSDCRYTGVFKHIDRRGNEESTLTLRRWSPHEMELVWDPLYDQSRFVWKIPEDYRRLLRSSQPPHFHLERANAEILETVAANKHLMFNDGFVHHMKEPALAGLRNRGWGVSRTLINFRQAWYCQVLHRYNEALALDYIIPFRVIMPSPKGGSDPTAIDPMLGLDMGNFVGRMQAMLRKRRQDPAAWHVSPFPVEYRALGGDARQFAPREMLDQGLDTLLNGALVPTDLYRGTLGSQTMPINLRLFESQHAPLVATLDGFLTFVCDQLSQLFNWEPVRARLVPPTFADDLNKQMAKLQLMMGRQISQTSGLRPLGMNFEEEQRRMLGEQEFVAKEQQRVSENMERYGLGRAVGQAGMPQQQLAAQMGGAGGAGGAAPPPGQPTQPNMPVTPQEMMQNASVLAEQLLALPESQRKSEMIQLGKQDPTMAALVKDQVEKQRRQAQTTGGAQLLQSQQGP